MLELLSREFNIKSYYGLSTCKIILVDCMPFYLDASWALLRNSKNYNGVQITDISQNIELPRSLCETSLLFCLVERLRGFWFAYNIVTQMITDTLWNICSLSCLFLLPKNGDVKIDFPRYIAMFLKLKLCIAWIGVYFRAISKTCVKFSPFGFASLSPIPENKTIDMFAC